MYYFYKGLIEGSIKSEEVFMLVKNFLDAENKLMEYYENHSRDFGELIDMTIFVIEASNFYGALKREKKIISSVSIR